MELQKLSDQELLSNVSKLMKCERECGAKLIAHLAEINQRGLHLQMGFKSLFEYCQRELKLEDGQIWLRIQVARKCSEFPELLKSLREGAMSLTVCGRIAPYLNQANSVALIRETEGMSRAEVEEYLVKLKPRELKNPSLRKAPAPSGPNVSPVTTEPSQSAELLFSETTPPAKAAELRPATPERYNLSLNISKETKAKLERLAEVLNLDVKNNLEELLNIALEAALLKKDPMRQKTRSKKTIVPKVVKKDKKRSRYIPRELRREILKRADYQCEYVSPDGRNGQMLCPGHNLNKAKNDFGRTWIEEKIKSKRESYKLQ